MFKVKLSALLVGFSMLVGLTTQAMAFSIGVGINAEGSYLETTGSETLKTTSVVTNATKSTGAFIPSGFVQLTFGDDGFVIGYSRAPGSAELGASWKSVQDWTKTAVSGANNVIQDAQAELRNLQNLYIETPTFGGMYLKGAYNQVELITNETLGTGASYGNEDINGTTLGIGWRSAGKGVLLKFEANYTDWDSVSLKSSGSDAVSTITGEPEQTSVKVSLGYNF